MDTLALKPATEANMQGISRIGLVSLMWNMINHGNFVAIKWPTITISLQREIKNS